MVGAALQKKISLASSEIHAEKCRIVHWLLQPLAMAYATACNSQCKRLRFLAVYETVFFRF